MKEVIEKFYCDLCEKEVEKYDLTKLKIPLTKEIETSYDGITITKIKTIRDTQVECCEDCRIKLNEAIDEIEWVESEEEEEEPNEEGGEEENTEGSENENEPLNPTPTEPNENNEGTEEEG